MSSTWALVSNEDIARLQVGLPARLKLDAYNFQHSGTIAGRVTFIAPDSQERAGETQRAYVVHIDLDNSNIQNPALLQPLKLGMTGQVEIISGRRNVLALFLERIDQAISFTTD